MTYWLKAVDCSLLQSGEADPLALRLVQRFLEIALVKTGNEDWHKALLEEITSVLRAEQAGIWEASPDWQARWQFLRRGTRAEIPARMLLGEVLDREAGVSAPPAAKQPAFLAACLSFTERPNRVLVVVRPRDAFEESELEYGVAMGHYLGIALERAKAIDQTRDKEERLHALVEIGSQMVEQRETVPLLGHIAEQSAKLLRCERASIFVWDRSRKELVGRPALGLPNGELRLPENTGVVGRVIATGEPLIVDNVRSDPNWSSTTDKSTGFVTRNLLCVPMNDATGQRIGAVEVMNKNEPFTRDDIATLEALAGQTATALANVREREALVRANNELEGQARLAARVVGVSPALVALRETIERVAQTDLPVLILGESGTGKEVVARALHYASPRHQNPFVPVNCAAIAETLLESELFGHEKGAFTDAHTTRAGKFEAATGGTLFLDEIGDMSAGGQAKLLRVLEEKVIYRVGGVQAIPVDTRIVAATNRNLAEAVRAGKFREDLFYRLTVVTLELSPLRDRRDDVLVLVEHFLQQFCKSAGRKPLKLAAEARKRLEQHDWPGNVRELRNLIERIAYLCKGDKVEAADVAFILHPGKKEAVRFTDLSLADATDAFQREHIQQAVERARGHMGEASRLLGLHRPNLHRKMKMLGIDPPA